jgi:hypothetical protein
VKVISLVSRPTGYWSMVILEHVYQSLINTELDNMLHLPHPAVS